jgi:putative spermidine/putrescine transport system ATP-binding protein
MTVAGNIGFPLKVRRLPKARVAERVAELLELVGLAGLDHRYPNQLSGGQQQRVALARALAPEPEVLLLDEPLSALDAVIRSGLRDEIRRIQQRVGITALYVTHDQAEAMAIADRVAVMECGRIVETGTPATIYDRPASHFTAVFVGSRNALELPVVGSKVSLGDAFEIDAPSSTLDRALVVFRPEDVRIEPETGPGHPALVDVIVFMGALTRVHVELNGTISPARLFADLPTRQARALAPGMSVRVLVEPASVLAFPAGPA